MKWFIRRCYLFLALLSVMGSFCADEPLSISSLASRCRARYEQIKKRAKEWYKKHKTGVKRATGVGVVAAAAVYAVTRYLNRDVSFAWRVASEKKLSNGIVLKQIKVDRQVGCTCGYHVVKNLILIANMLPPHKGMLNDTGGAEKYNQETTEKIAPGGEWKAQIAQKRRESYRVNVATSVRLKAGRTQFKDKVPRNYWPIYSDYMGETPIEEIANLIDEKFLQTYLKFETSDNFTNIKEATDEQLRAIHLQCGGDHWSETKVAEVQKKYQNEDALEWLVGEEIKIVLTNECKRLQIDDLTQRCGMRNLMSDGTSKCELPSQQVLAGPFVPLLIHVDGNHWIAMVRHTCADDEGKNRIEYIIADSFNSNRLDYKEVHEMINAIEGSGTI